MAQRRPAVGYPKTWPAGKTKFFTITFDDLESRAFTFLDDLESIGCRAAFGFGMSYLNESMRDDEISAVTPRISFRQVQLIQQRGHEIAYHGYIHPDANLGGADVVGDIASYESRLAELNAQHSDLPPVRIYGYIGPNQVGLTEELDHKYWWARPGAWGSSALGVTYFGTDYGLLETGFWLDDKVTQSLVDSIVSKATSLSDGQWINICCHTHWAADANLWALDRQLFTRLQSEAGMICVTPCRAVRHTVFNTGNIGNRTTVEVLKKNANSAYVGGGSGGWNITSETGKTFTYGTPENTLGHVAFFGDSITHSATSIRVEEVDSCDFPSQLAKRAGAGIKLWRERASIEAGDFINCGESGFSSKQICYRATGFGDSSGNSYSDLTPYKDSLGAISILCGYNDHQTVAKTFAQAVPQSSHGSYASAIAALNAGASITVGSETISTVAAYYAKFDQNATGQLAFMAEWLHEKYPQTNIIVMTMYQRPDVGAGAAGHYETAATESAKYVAEALPYVSLVSMEDLEFDASDYRDGATMLHPNKQGSEKIADYIFADFDVAAYDGTSASGSESDIPDPPTPPVQTYGSLYLFGGQKITLAQAIGMGLAKTSVVWKFGGNVRIDLANGGEVPDDDTSLAILGSGVLGSMILGKSS